MNRTCCCQHREPKLWFNEVKHPASFEIGRFAVPAFFLPFAIAFSFLVHRLYQWQTGSKQPVFIDHAGKSYPQEKEVPPDTENQLENEEPKPHSNLQRRLGGYISFHHRIWTLQPLYNPSSLFRANILISGLLEALLLLAAGAYLDRQVLRPCVFAAIGWIALLPQEHFGMRSVAISVGIIALALPCASMQATGGDKYASSNSAIVLLFLQLNRHIPADSSIRYPKFYELELWPLGMLLAFAMGHSLVNMAKDAARCSSSLAQTSSTFAKEIGAALPDIAWEIVRVVAFLSPMALFFVVSGFCSSCLGWNWVIAKEPATSPGIGGGSFIAGLLFLGVWCSRAVVLRRPKVERQLVVEILREEMVFGAESAAWTVVGTVGLWVCSWSR